LAPILAATYQTQLVVGGICTAVAATILYATGRYIGLPGALWAFPMAAAIGVLYAALKHLTSQKWLRQPPISVGFALGLAGLVMGGVVSQSSVRHDYYWNLGTEYQQNLTARFPDAQARALAAYEIAEQYGAPDEQRQLELMINMGLAHSRMNEFPAAHARYDRALEIDPESYHARFNKGVAYQVEGQWDRAAECFERVTEIQSNFAPAYRELGRVQEQQGKLTKALVNLRTAGRLIPDDPTIQQDIARVRQSRDAANESQKHAKSE
jgi:tetratricopeptide (TPR) repeat protein